MDFTSRMDQSDWNSFHDVIFNITHDKNDLSNEVLRKVFDTLDEDLKMDAYRWGMSDTVVRDNIYDHLLNENKQWRKIISG